MAHVGILFCLYDHLKQLKEENIMRSEEHTSELQSPAGAPHNMLLRELYNKYASQGLEIYQISLDADEHYWKTAAANLPWICVRDGNGVYSTNVAVYNVRQVPSIFLINRNNELKLRGEDIKDLEASVKSLL